MLHFFGTIFVGIFATQTAWKISLFGWFFGLFNVIPVAIEVRNTRPQSTHGCICHHTHIALHHSEVLANTTESGKNTYTRDSKGRRSGYEPCRMITNDTISTFVPSTT